MSHQLHHLLAHAATERPDHRAVIDGDASITYGDLERSAAGLAATLRAMGVRPGDRVGLFLPKSIPSIVGIFGILKAGGVYVPIDPLAPATRAALIVGDCGIRCLITTADRLGQLTEAVPKGALSGAVLTDGPAVAAFGMPTRAWAEAVDAPALQMEHDGVETDLGYILYTSGSTGIPKGVMISHRAALTFIEWTCERFRMSGDDVVSSHAPLHFDLSIFDVFTTIKAGGTIVLVPDRLSTFPIKLTQLIRDAGITVWYSVPSALVLMLTRGKFAETALPTLRTILFAGEVFPMKYLRELRAATHAQLFNLYGPTETNVCTYYQVNDLPQHWTAIPIGTAISNYDVFALDDRGRRIGAGDVGELFARGPGLMSGYWGDVEKTDQVLVENPLPGPFAERVCRTGDLVTLDSDGQYLYLGRRDHMVKIRGYRVELGEVEAALYEHPDVHEAAAYVVADAEGTTHLFASVVMSEGQAMTSKDLQTFCAGRLPKYMVPETIDLERALPKTSTGKVDRPALVAARESDGAPAARRA